MSENPDVYAVDDDEAVLASVKAVLSLYGHRVTCFSSAEHFLQEAMLQRPGCVVTDLQMPEVSGVELQRRLLAAQSPLAVVVVTGVADVPTAVTMMERGAVTLLEKPYDHAALLQAVERGLAASHQRAQQRLAEQRLSQLSGEERRVLEGMLAGLPNKAIAATTGLSMRTLDRRRQAVLDRMGVRSVPELATMLGSIRNWRNLATLHQGEPADNRGEP